MAAPKIGSIIEFTTNRGLAYGVYTHKHSDYGYLLRMFKGFYETRPDDLNTILKNDVVFSTFFPLAAAVNRKIVLVAGVVEIPEPLSPFPMFRAGNYNAKAKTVDQWWLWDGEKEWMVPELTEEEWKYPIQGVSNDSYIIELLESGYVEAGSLF